MRCTVRFLKGVLVSCGELWFLKWFLKLRGVEMKRIILSRKGFDDGYGKMASPIFEDSRMLSLPIPNERPYKTTPYEQINFKYQEDRLADILSSLTRRKAIKNQINGKRTAHLDPDIRQDALDSRPKGWKGAFGQVAESQSYLKKEGVNKGDIFLFYGWFDDVKKANNNYHFLGNNRHVIWGWLQIDKIFHLENGKYEEELECIKDHPHLHLSNYVSDKQEQRFKNNTVYIASEKLIINGKNVNNLAGWGTFENYNEKLVLTNLIQDKQPQQRSKWIVPKWMEECKSIKKLSDNERKGFINVQNTRFQEKVLDVSNLNNKNEAEAWLTEIFSVAKS
jgi:hypothetical protein